MVNLSIFLLKAELPQAGNSIAFLLQLFHQNIRRDRVEDNVLKKIKFGNYIELKNFIRQYTNNYNLYIKQKILYYNSPVKFLKNMKKYENWKQPIPYNQKRYNKNSFQFFL